MRRMLDPKTIGGGGGGIGEIHVYDVQYRDTPGEFYFSFVSIKVLPGFTKQGDTLVNQSRKDYPELFPKNALVIPCSGSIKKDNTYCPCFGFRIVESEYETKGYVRLKIIYNGNNVSTELIPTNRRLSITMRY